MCEGTCLCRYTLCNGAISKNIFFIKRCVEYFTRFYYNGFAINVTHQFYRFCLVVNKDSQIVAQLEESIYER